MLSEPRRLALNISSSQKLAAMIELSETKSFTERFDTKLENIEFY